MQHRITIEGSEQAYVSHAGQSVLDAMVGRPSAVEVGCRSGGCGVCRIEVLSGRYERGVMSAEQISAECRSKGYVLACRIYPETDLHLRPIGKRTSPGCTPNPDIAALLASLSKLARCGLPNALPEP
ncbi:2Fe-2S iron-sulfur cluster binding domain-containing protein [Nevskia sp.]|uniref:2Fe-2S iron-sulfur cluster binding domain-containing protein n=1 Tax=Nevskia sp. TaxID=1929292 RepID=UPI0025EF91A9|nr:2Fe-2S iron-sulfur cluster binding domain-containing protein [Nevskia sp.]